LNLRPGNVVVIEELAEGIGCRQTHVNGEVVQLSGEIAEGCTEPCDRCDFHFPAYLVAEHYHLIAQGRASGITERDQKRDIRRTYYYRAVCDRCTRHLNQQTNNPHHHPPAYYMKLAENRMENALTLEWLTIVQPRRSAP